MLLKHNKTQKYMSFKDIRASKKTLSDIGISNSNVHWNLSSDELEEHSISSGHAIRSSQGAITINTGKFTGRSLKIDLLLKIQLQKILFGGVISIYHSVKISLINFIKK